MTYEQKRKLALEAELETLRELTIDTLDLAQKYVRLTKRIESILADRPRDIGDLTMDELAALNGGIRRQAE